MHLSGRRADHALAVLAAAEGDVLRVGRLRGLMGTARVLASGPELVLAPTLDTPPPARPGIDLLLALPRPKALKKVLPAAASLGVDRIVLVNAARVEKSYFDSHVLSPDSVDGLLALGLEQARDTVPPTVLVRERFRPFVEDELDGLFGRSRRLLPHPAAERSFPDLAGPPEGGRVVLAVGPEGGWVPFEVSLLAAHGFTPFTAGPRVLRVETVVPFLAGLLAAGRGPGG